MLVIDSIAHETQKLVLGLGDQWSIQYVLE